MAGEKARFACHAFEKHGPGDNKYLMTGSQRNSDFCFHEIFYVPRSEAEGKIGGSMSRGTNFTVSLGAIH